MGRGEREEGKDYDSDKYYRANIDAKRATLQLSMPLIKPYILHPKWLHAHLGAKPKLRWLEGSHPRRSSTMPEVRDVEGCLWQFVHLHNATDKQILEFAAEWGILGIWPTWEWEDNPQYDPPTHNPLFKSPFPPSREEQALSSPGYPWSRELLWFCETTDLWRRLSRHFLAILRLTAVLGDPNTTPGNYGDKQDWQEVVGGGDWEGWQPGKGPKSVFVVEEQAPWNTLQYAVQRWLKQMTFSFSIEPESHAFKAHLDINQMPINWTQEQYEICTERHGPGYRQIEFHSDYAYCRDKPYLPMRSSILLNILIVQLVAAITSPLMVCQNPECASIQPRKRAGKRYCDKPECKTSYERQRKALQRAKKEIT